MSEHNEEILVNSELELGKLKFQNEALAEAKELGLIKDEEVEDNKNQEESNKPTERQYTEVELEQMELGWDPNKTGPKAVSAEEFKRVGEIIEAKRAASKRAENANKEVQELTKTVKQLVEHNKKLEKASYARALEELKQERNEKILTGDVDAVNQLDLKKQVLEKAQESIDKVEPEIKQQELSAEANEYMERNKFWLYGQSAEDKKMQILTNKVIDYLKEAEPNISEKDAILAIEMELKTKFPHRFDNPNKEKAPAVLPKSTNTGKSKISLTTEENHQFLSIQRIDPSFTLDEYVKQLETIGRRS